MIVFCLAFLLLLSASPHSWYSSTSSLVSSQPTTTTATALDFSSAYSDLTADDEDCETNDNRMKTILITGSTDGIGLEAAKLLVARGHRVLLHGRNPSKVELAETLLLEQSQDAAVESYVADLSTMAQVETLATQVLDKHSRLDVLISNAGVFATPNPRTQEGLDSRFAVNTIAPYLLLQRLSPALGKHGRVVNISSAGQAPVNLQALAGRIPIADAYNAYAQSKLAQIMWTRHVATHQTTDGPDVISVNPGSYLGTKMVKEGFGMEGRSVDIGAEILAESAVGKRFQGAGGKYFDNDSGQFQMPHRDAMDAGKCAEVVRVMDEVLAGVATAS